MPFAYLWKNVGYYSVFYVAAIAGISTGAVGLILGIIIGVVLWLPMGIYIYNKANITSDALENIQSIQDELDSYDTNYDSFYDYDDDYDF